MWFIKKRHSKATESKIHSAFPRRLRDSVKVALGKFGVAPHEPLVDPGCEVLVADELLSIPYRVYFPPSSINQIGDLTPTERAIFAAIMTRHHDGHQREYWARILCGHPSSWTAPYLAALLGDYVIQVLKAICRDVTDDWKPIMAKYSEQNRISLSGLNHRILTYWTIYYRHHPPNIRILTDYPGYRLADKLGLWDRRTAPKLLRKAKKAADSTAARITPPAAQ